MNPLIRIKLEARLARAGLRTHLYSHGDRDLRLFSLYLCGSLRISSSTCAHVLLLLCVLSSVAAYFFRKRSSRLRSCASVTQRGRGPGGSRAAQLRSAWGPPRRGELGLEQQQQRAEGGLQQNHRSGSACPDRTGAGRLPTMCNPLRVILSRECVRLRHLTCYIAAPLCSVSVVSMGNPSKTTFQYCESQAPPTRLVPPGARVRLMSERMLVRGSTP